MNWSNRILERPDWLLKQWNIDFPLGEMPSKAWFDEKLKLGREIHVIRNGDITWDVLRDIVLAESGRQPPRNLKRAAGVLYNAD